MSTIIPGLISCIRRKVAIVDWLDGEGGTATTIDFTCLVKLNRRLRCPVHLLTDGAVQIGRALRSNHVRFANAEECLLLHVEVFEEDYDMVLGDFCKWLREGLAQNQNRILRTKGSPSPSYLIGLGLPDVKVQSEITLSCRHIVSDGLHSFNPTSVSLS
jgi:hypothetical protein